MKKYKSYFVVFQMYHGTNNNDAEKIKNIGFDELFFSSSLLRAKSYSIDGTVLKINKKIEFNYMNDAKKFIRKYQTIDFIDLIINGKEVNKIKVLKYKKSSSPTSGKAEEIFLLGDKKYIGWANKLSPSQSSEQYQYKNMRIHKFKQF